MIKKCPFCKSNVTHLSSYKDCYKYLKFLCDYEIFVGEEIFVCNKTDSVITSSEEFDSEWFYYDNKFYEVINEKSYNETFFISYIESISIDKANNDKGYNTCAFRKDIFKHKTLLNKALLKFPTVKREHFSLDKINTIINFA